MHLEREINEQPDVLSRLLKEQGEATVQIAAAIRDFDPAFVAVAARGTSDNAARYAQYLFGAKARLPVMLSTPSLHTLYQAPPDLSRALVVGVSQSGQAEDVRRVLQDAGEQGALTVSLTNYEDSPLAQTAAHHLYLNAGEEQSIAATKTYTAQLTAFAMLCAALLQDETMHDELKQIPRYVQQAVNAAEDIDAWVERYRYMTQFTAIGRGYNYATAFEISLKVKELCYINGEGYSEADFRHGPIAMIAPGFPVVLIAPQGKTLATLRDLLDKLEERAAEVLIISNEQTLLELTTRPMPVPVIPEWLSPVVTVIPGQVFAMRQAQTRGYEVDKPRGLSKVTVTE
jgi:glutamine---fructose-6-phosphate transaminase (isomerizing)